MPWSIPFRPIVGLRAAAAGFLLFTLLAPDGLRAQKIAFVSNRDGGNNEIYVMNADGSGQTRLTDSADSESQPRWSPDGTRILFTRLGANPAGPSEIYVMNANGSSPVNLTNEPAAIDGNGRWSPDGKKILFVSNRAAPADRSFALYVMDADGTSPTRYGVDLTASQSVVSPVWSPDGTRIAYVRTSGGDTALYVVNISNGETEQVYAGAAVLSGPQWSPDGTQIVAGGEGGLYLLDADSPAAPQLLNVPPKSVDLAGAYNPAWSPNGQKLAYSQWWPYVMNSDGSGITQLVNDPDSLSFSQLEWTQDGSKILGGVSQSGFDIKNRDIYMMNPDGSGLQNLTENNADESDFDAFGDFSGAPPQISEGGVVMANLVPAVNQIAPLAIVSIFGSGFSAGSFYYPTLDNSGKITSIRGGTCVEMNGQRAPILAMLPSQANVQAPSNLSLGPVTVSVVRNCGTANEVRSAAKMVDVLQASPAFFVAAPYKADGYVAARFNDGFAAVAPAGAIVDQQGTSRPAQPGEVIVLFGVGWGATEPAVSTGELASGAAVLLPAANPMVSFGGVFLAPEDILYVGATPQAAGLYQLAMKVPANAQPGDNQVVLTLYGKSTPVGPVVPIVLP